MYECIVMVATTTTATMAPPIAEVKKAKYILVHGDAYFQPPGPSRIIAQYSAPIVSDAVAAARRISKINGLQWEEELDLPRAPKSNVSMSMRCH